MGEVKRFEKPIEAEEMLPPFDISMAINFAEGRQIMLRSPVIDPITKAEADRRTDLLMAVVDRQRSIFEIRVIEAEQQDKRAALAVWQKTRDEKDARLKKRLTEVADEIERLMIHREQVQTNDRIRHDQQRQGPWKAQGAIGKQLDNIGKDIDAQQARIKTIESEHEQDMQTVLRNIEQLEQHIRANERILAEHRKIVDGG